MSPSQVKHKTHLNILYSAASCMPFPSLTVPLLCASCPAGTPLSGEGGATPASVGIKLAERLHEVASQLQQPAAEPAAYTATPGGAAPQLRTPAAGLGAGAGGGAGAGRFDFAADVAAMLQVGHGVTRCTGWLAEVWVACSF
jgi:hypothetical protein